MPTAERLFTADEIVKMADETSDHLGNLYYLAFITRIRHEAKQPGSVRLLHHVVLKNGRDDIVCSCGKHFARDPRANNMSRQGRSAITQWVEHWHEEDKI